MVYTYLTCKLVNLMHNIFLQVECVGSVESGITAMSWSPETEILIITTGIYPGVPYQSN